MKQVTQEPTEAEITEKCIKLGWDPNDRLDRLMTKNLLEDPQVGGGHR